MVAALPEHRSLADYRGLGRQRPWLAGALLVSLLGLLGTPPTAVFVGKLGVASAAWDGGLPWLAVAVSSTRVVSLFYYLRWFAPTVARTASGAAPPSPRRFAEVAAVLAAVASLGLGLMAGTVLGALA